MAATTIGRTRALFLALALMTAACGGGGGDSKQCRTCTVDDDCKSDQQCVLAVDGVKRCFDDDKNSCTVDRVPVARESPIPEPTSTPKD